MNRKIISTATAILIAFLCITRNNVVARPDAVSAASLTVTVTSVTATTAVITYSKDKYDYGTRTLCYDPAPAVAKNNCTVKNAAGNQGTFTISGLSSGIVYNFNIQAIDTQGGEKPYATAGSFTTLTSTVISPASISTQPSNQTVKVGSAATFSVIAAGTPTLTYQWRKGGVNITGATLASYTTPATVIGDNGGLYSVVINNGAMLPVTSANATLTVQPVTQIASYAQKLRGSHSLHGEVYDLRGRPILKKGTQTSSSVRPIK